MTNVTPPPTPTTQFVLDPECLSLALMQINPERRRNEALITPPPDEDGNDATDKEKEETEVAASADTKDNETTDDSGPTQTPAQSTHYVDNTTATTIYSEPCNDTLIAIRPDAKELGCTGDSSCQKDPCGGHVTITRRRRRKTGRIFSIGRDVELTIEQVLEHGFDLGEIEVYANGV